MIDQRKTCELAITPKPCQASRRPENPDLSSVSRSFSDICPLISDLCQVCRSFHPFGAQWSHDRPTEDLRTSHHPKTVSSLATPRKPRPLLRKSFLFRYL